MANGTGKNGNGHTVKKSNGKPRHALGPGPGRPKGTPNKVTIEAKKAATELVDDPVYRAKLMADLRARKLAPAIEQMLWYYSKGVPKRTIQLESGDTPVVFTLKIEDARNTDSS